MKRIDAWARHYRDEVENNIIYYNFMNQIHPVWTRPLTDKEKQEIFGDNPDYIKNLGRNDGKEWRLVDEDNLY